MAHLYRRNRSPYWWVKCRDCKASSPTLGKTIRTSTRFRIGIGPDTRKATQLCAELTLAETRCKPSSTGSWDWVDPYLAAYRRTPITLVRYRTVWRNFTAFLTERNIPGPQQLTRADCLAYFDWRSHPDRAAGKYHACHNPAHTELKIVGLLSRPI